jgi:hypothetical protein
MMAGSIRIASENCQSASRAESMDRAMSGTVAHARHAATSNDWLDGWHHIQEWLDKTDSGG